MRVAGGLRRNTCQRCAVLHAIGVEGHVAEGGAVGFTCSPWLLGSKLADVLPADSNVLAFQRLFELVPSNSNDRQMCERVFEMWPLDLDKAPQTTSMQRAILAYYRKGGRIEAGAGFRPITQQ